MKLTPVAELPSSFGHTGRPYGVLRSELRLLYPQMEPGRWYLVEDLDAKRSSFGILARRAGLRVALRSTLDENGEKVTHTFIQRPATALEVVGASA